MQEEVQQNQQYASGKDPVFLKLPLGKSKCEFLFAACASALTQMKR